MHLALALILGFLPAQERLPWRTDVDAARTEARLAGKPCIIFLRIESPAL